MITSKPDDPAIGLDIESAAVAKVNFLHVPIKIAGKDIVLNVSFKEAMIRFVITLFLPMLMLIIDKHLIIYTAPVMAYLFITGITHFCFIKYAWHRFIMHEISEEPLPYGENPEYPEESV
jgi:hypothetical protein